MLEKLNLYLLLMPLCVLSVIRLKPFIAACMKYEISLTRLHQILQQDLKCGRSASSSDEQKTAGIGPATEPSYTQRS